MNWWDAVLQNLEHLDAGIKIILGLLATLLLFGKKIRNGWGSIKGFVRKADNALDTLNGREAIRHPDTGAVLAEATLPLAQRINTIESSQAEMSTAIKLLSENQTRMMKVEDTLADLQAKLEERDHMGEQIIEEWTDWRQSFAQAKMDDHDKMWQAIEDLRKDLI